MTDGKKVVYYGNVRFPDYADPFIRCDDMVGYPIPYEFYKPFEGKRVKVTVEEDDTTQRRATTLAASQRQFHVEGKE